MISFTTIFQNVLAPFVLPALAINMAAYMLKHSPMKTPYTPVSIFVMTLLYVLGYSYFYEKTAAEIFEHTVAVIGTSNFLYHFNVIAHIQNMRNNKKETK